MVVEILAVTLGPCVHGQVLDDVPGEVRGRNHDHVAVHLIRHAAAGLAVVVTEQFPVRVVDGQDVVIGAHDRKRVKTICGNDDVVKKSGKEGSKLIFFLLTLLFEKAELVEELVTAEVERPEEYGEASEVDSELA